jgi:hypothetical protein
MQRAVIVGTAPSWKRAPWTDPGVRIVSLNDAYMLGLPRADEWYELHPLDQMWFRPKHQKVIHADQVPKNVYIRPEGHHQWLQEQARTIPVWLQHEPPAGWPPNAQRLPLEALEAKYGTYWASGPAYILMHLYERGFREFQIYGIHLATEHEYREQRPNFEALLRGLIGPTVKESKQKGLRIYDGAECRVVLPEEAPILQHGWKYAYEHKPEKPVNPYAVELKQTQKARARLMASLVTWPTGKDKSRALAELKRLEIIELDCQQMLQKMMGSGTLTAVRAA